MSSGRKYKKSKIYWGTTKREIFLLKELNKMLGTSHKSWAWAERYVNLPQEFIDEFAEYLNWYTLAGYKQLSEQIVKKHKNKFEFYIPFYVRVHRRGKYRKLSKTYW